MRQRTLIDTSGFFAFINKADVNYKTAQETFKSSKLITTNYIFDELMTLLTARGKKELSIAFGEELRTRYPVHHLSAGEEEKAWQLYKKYRDHLLSFTDCTTLLVLRDHKIPQLFSFDQDLLSLSQAIKSAKTI